MSSSIAATPLSPSGSPQRSPLTPTSPERVSPALAAATALALRSVPSLRTRVAHKGGHGKVLIVGGSANYSGAPFYAAISALKVGCDLAWIMCSRSAASAIKAYSPEPIVMPSLPEGNTSGSADADADAVRIAVAEFIALASRVDAVVVGPGLGRDPLALRAAAEIVAACRARRLPVVLDGDGLFMLSQRPDLLSVPPLGKDGPVFGEPQLETVVVTPNAAEFARLWGATAPAGELLPSSDGIEAALLLAQRLGPGVIVLRKGRVDAVAAAAGTPSAGLLIDEAGSPRRCGGQGDVLAGAVGTFLAWAANAGFLSPRRDRQMGAEFAIPFHGAVAGQSPSQLLQPQPLQAEVVLAAAAAAARVTRIAAALAFASKRRSMTTPDLIALLGDAFEATLPNA
jgi:ATP-dependent NAD(P)H-hydrate dehydratase